MGSLLHRRLDALERAGIVSAHLVDGCKAEAFVDFLAETFERENSSHADAAARLFGLPAARQFIELVVARFDSEAYARIARHAYGDAWEERSAKVAESAAAGCRDVHGDEWGSMLADRIASAKRVSRYRMDGGERC